MARGPSVRLWHRRLGLTAAAFVLLLSVTGLMLNHAGALRLNETKIESAWILSLYGMQGVGGDAHAFDIEQHTASWAGGWVFLDQTPLVGAVATLRGAVGSNGLIVLAAPREMLLFTDEGELIERFLPSSFGAEIDALGTTTSGPIARVGSRLFASGPDAAVWTEVREDASEILWSTKTPVPEELVSALNYHLRGEGLPLYRIILDIHSGHIISEIGVLLMDGAAILLIALSLTGIWIWWPRSR